ncbi:fatty acid desaturase family protein [Stenotrophobium rhamnosiphilum]|uniref:Fatty acid desaturase n=1 Tax=Stenotrophobium rhamnosiphilum TaxID=2029166 RepID=A0A2T5MIH0_9GAMM|nr:fatty acid desaturase family protein [Stenotrophobium rhamnosiphilum]PTU32393.1 fatty acid desaturase [Stenotrophobium rhamnosiphilum]
MNTVEITSSTPTELPQATRRRINELFSREEIAQFTARSDWRGAWAVASTWLIIAASLFMLARWPNPLTFIAALVLIAGRQLALAILQHEAAHGTLFKTRWMNNFFGDWFCARPVWQHLQKYREHHFVHHTKTGTDADPDMSLHSGYPTTRSSMLRKTLRDVSGITGLKLMLGLVLMDAGLFKWTVSNHLEKLPQEGRRWWSYPLNFLRNASGMIITNAILFGVCAASGHAWLYGVWVLAYITPFPLFVRIRSLAEHGMLERVPDMFLNTRSTRAGWIARITVAPVNVNYHIEHHAMASVPFYRLPQMHRLLRERDAVPEAPGYLDVLRIASTPVVA